MTSLPEGFVTAAGARPWHIDEDIFNDMKNGVWDAFMAQGGVVLYHKPAECVSNLLGHIVLRPLTEEAALMATGGVGQADAFLPGEQLEECLTPDARYNDIKRKEKEG